MRTAIFRGTCSSRPPTASPAPRLSSTTEATAPTPSCGPGWVSRVWTGGYNTVIFDGPGQQSMLFQRGIPFGPTGSAWITPLVKLPEPATRGRCRQGSPSTAPAKLATGYPERLPLNIGSLLLLPTRV